MDARLPAVLQRMASLASLHIVRAWASGHYCPAAAAHPDKISSPLAALSAISCLSCMQLSRLQELRLGMAADAGHMRRALHGILPLQPSQPGHQLPPDAAAAEHYRPADSLSSLRLHECH
jgi:hypothetical protein